MGAAGTHGHRIGAAGCVLLQVGENAVLRVQRQCQRDPVHQQDHGKPPAANVNTHIVSMAMKFCRDTVTLRPT